MILPAGRPAARWLIGFLLSAFCFPLFGAVQITTATLTVTNTAGATNGHWFRIFQGSDATGYLYTFTNRSPVGFHYISTTNAAGYSAATTLTNTYRKLTNDWTSKNLRIRYASSTSLTIQSDGALALTLTIGTNWGTLAIVTNSTVGLGTFSTSNLVASAISLSGETIEAWSDLGAASIPDNSITTNKMDANAYAVFTAGGGSGVTNNQYLPGIPTSTNANLIGTFTGNGAGLTNLPGTNAQTYYVDLNGSDTTGNGTFLFPFRSVTNAIAKGGDGARIQIGSGTFVSGQIDTKYNQAIVGASDGSTVLLGTNQTFFLITNGVTVENLTIQLTNRNGALEYPVVSHSWATNVNFLDCTILGESDCILFQTPDCWVDLNLWNCRLRSAYDALNINQAVTPDEFEPEGSWRYPTNSVVRFFNCDVQCRYDGTPFIGYAGEIRSLLSLHGRIEVYGGRVASIDSPTNGSAIRLKGAFGSVFVSPGTTLTATSTNGQLCTITNDSTGSVVVGGPTVARRTLGGRIAVIDEQPWGTNAIATSGGVTNRWNPVAIGASASGVGKISFNNDGSARFADGATVVSTVGNVNIGSGNIILNADGTSSFQGNMDASFSDITANAFIGGGGGLTALNASQLTSGTVSEQRLHYAGTDPAAGLVLTSTSSNTPAWLAPTVGGFDPTISNSYNGTFTGTVIATNASLQTIGAIDPDALLQIQTGDGGIFIGTSGDLETDCNSLLLSADGDITIRTLSAGSSLTLQDVNVQLTGAGEYRGNGAGLTNLNLNGYNPIFSGLTVTGATPGLILVTNPASASYVKIGTNDSIFGTNGGLAGMSYTLTNGGARFSSNVVAAKFFGDGSALTGISGGGANYYSGDYYLGEFMENATPFGRYVFTANSGSILPVTTPLDTTHFGVVQLSTSSSATAAPVLTTAQPGAFLPGSGYTITNSWWLRLEDLSTGAENYQLRAGFSDSTTSAEPTDAVMFRYSSDTNSGNWQLVTRAVGAESVSNTVSAVSADTWYKLTVEVNSTSTLASFYVNDTLVGTLASNIPDVDSSVNRCFGSVLQMVKAVGTTARICYVDAVTYAVNGPARTP